MRAPVAAALLLGALEALARAQAPAAPVPAPGSRATLIYVREGGAEACPDEAAVRRAVELRLGYDPFSPEATRTVTATVRGTGRGSARALMARIVLSNAAGERSGRREITSPRLDCQDLAPAMELAVALAIDPLSATRLEAPPADAAQGDLIVRELGGAEEPKPGAGPPAPVAPPLPPPPLPPPPTSSTPPTPPAPRQTSPREPTRVRLGAGTFLGLGGAPSLLYPGFLLQLGFRETRWSVSIELRGDVPIEVEAAAAPPARISTWQLLGALVPCVHVPLAAGGLEIAACALMAGGAQFASGGNLLNQQSQQSPSAHLGLRAALEWPFASRFVLRAHADALAALTRPEIQASGVTLFSTPAASGALGVDLLVLVR